MSLASDAQYQWYYPNFLTAPVEVSTSTSSARSTALPVGLYRLTVTTAAYFKIGGATVVAATSGANLGHIVAPYGSVDIFIGDGTNKYVALITASGTGIAQLARQIYVP